MGVPDNCVAVVQLKKTYDLLGMHDWCLLLRPLQQGEVPLAHGAGAR